jgi:NAD(P)-dependent dehydrogenase (short-subunit alcohol dehydrogenase family)
MKPVAVVTGATSGIGVEIARGLAQAAYPVVIVGRDAAKVRATQDEIQRSVGDTARISGEIADLASLAQVNDLAARLAAAYPTTGLLVNNAGVFAFRKTLSADGIELDLAVNHLAPFLLTWRLLPTLRQHPDARVVVINSDAHERARLRAADLTLDAPFSAWGAYSKSKLASMASIVEYAARIPADSVIINAVHPGAVGTNIGNVRGPAAALWGVVKRLMLTPRQGADTPLWAATSPDLATTTGAYLKKRAVAAMNPQAHDPHVRATVWARTLELVGLSKDATIA